jgi:alpha-D-xyloside xylohydrolase
MLNRSWAALLLAALCLAALPIRAGAAADCDKQADGIVLKVKDGSLKLQVMDDNIIRVAFAKDPAFFTRKTIDVVAQPKNVFWTLSTTPQSLTLATAKVKARVDRKTGQVSFFDPNDEPILAEAANGRMIEPAEVQGESTFHIRQQWKANPSESLYGLGQHQLGMLDIKGYDMELWQHNTAIVVPFLVSSRGYGIYWENISITRFGDLRPFVAIPAENLLDKNGEPGGLTESRMDGAEPATKVAKIDINYPPASAEDGSNAVKHPDRQWEGSVLAPETGDYQFKTYSNGGIKVWVDGKLLINHWRQNWLTNDDQVKVHLVANKKYPIKIEWDTEQGSTLQLTWKTPSPEADKTSLWSEVGDGIDYYFVYGPKLDTVVAGMRTLTGKANLMPSWAFGLWQSRQRYETEDQGLNVVKEFRARKIPFDNIVQDWQYWPIDKWGSHQFDSKRFPNPDAWIKSIHDLNAHLMISVWGKFYPGTDNFEAMQKAGYLYQPNLDEGMKDWIGYVYAMYDAYNPEARKLFWQQVNERLFRRGIDAWWMDATEPDLTPSPPTIEGQKTHFPKTYMGTASRVFNGYALLNSEGVYEGQRSVAPNQRVFILTRSGYAGEQRYSAASWSGDISATWTAMAKQIPAGLDLSIAGLPYWTQDVGGYAVRAAVSAKDPKPEDDENWFEMNARWFEFGTFTPLLRVHGEGRVREMWTMGGDQHPAYKAEVKFDNLRYRMFPYIYSLAGDVTHNSGLFMRPLVMDFPADTTARELNDEYMFGHEFLVAPVTQYQARSRSVYLPKGALWYDFWTGKTATSGKSFDAPAPLDQMPLFVRAGSIIPFGPERQYILEKQSDPITLYVYAGANGQFTLYEDEGTNYDYEKSLFAQIPMQWNEATRTLTIGQRQGTFPGMLESRTFQVVLVSQKKSTGFSFEPTPLKSVEYKGEAVSLKLQ